MFNNITNEALQYKLTSVRIRFNIQASAIEAILNSDKLILGLGAQKALTLNDLGKNLHNNYLQIFVEMGILTSSFVLFIV